MLLNILTCIVGVIIGYFVSVIIRTSYTSIGTLEVDHVNELAHVNLKSDDFRSRKKKMVILKVDHDADLSQK